MWRRVEDKYKAIPSPETSSNRLRSSHRYYSAIIDMSSRRSPNPSSRSSSKQPAQQLQQKKVPAELVTYRLDSEMVYVEPAKDIEEAINFAQGVFPQLVGVARSQIAFSVNVRVNGALKTVRIAPMAWSRVLRSLATYEIIDISLLELPLATSSRFAKSESELAASVASAGDDMPPPQYASGSGNGMLGANLCRPTLDTNSFRDSEKSPFFTLQQTSNPPLPSSSSPVMKRCTSALSWFGKRR